MSDMTPTEAAIPTLANGGALQQVKTQFATAMTVQKPRKLPEVETRLLAEADQAGEDFYYGWGAGKDRVEGGSVGLAMAAVRNFGNCCVQMEPVQDTRDSWIFTASFVDLETGFTLQRQFRQSKEWTVYGKFDAARKEDIRFQIGQSKAIRNVVMNALPKYLLNRAIEKAKGGVRESIEKAIEKQAEHHEGSIDEGRLALAEIALERLSGYGITEDQVLSKFGRRTKKAITVDDLVLLHGDIHALKNGLETAEHLYPPAEQSESNEDDRDDRHPFGDSGARPQDFENPTSAKKAGAGNGASKKTSKPKSEKKAKPPADDDADEEIPSAAEMDDSDDDAAGEPEAAEEGDEDDGPSEKFNSITVLIDSALQEEGVERSTKLLHAKQRVNAAKGKLSQDEFDALLARVEEELEKSKRKKNK